MHSSYPIQVLDRHLVATDLVMREERVLGRQIAEVAGFMPEEAIILRHRQGHPLTELGPDEFIDLRSDMVERFVIGSGDRTYLMAIDGVRSDWVWKSIGAETVRKLAGRDDGFEVLLERGDVSERVLLNAEEIDLGEAGVERFITRRVARDVEVTYNSRPFAIKAGTYSTEQLKSLFKVRPGYVLDLIPCDGDIKELAADEEIRVISGLVFASHAPVGQSS